MEELKQVLNFAKVVLIRLLIGITSFCARLYGKRRSKRKTEQLIKELKKETNAN